MTNMTDQKSEKEQKLLSLKEAGFNVPEFWTLDCGALKNTQSMQDILFSMIKMTDVESLIVRSSHPLEGNNGLSWSGIFESVLNAPVSYHGILEAYQIILKNDYKALRYAKRNDVLDFSMNDMGVIVMPCLNWERHFMIRSRSKNFGGGLSILIFEKDRKFGDVGVVDNSECDEHGEISKRYRREADLAYQVISHFGSPQEVEICEYQRNLYVLQSRNFNPEEEIRHELPAYAELPDKILPIYVIDESEKELEIIDNEIRVFGLTHDEHVILVLDASKTMNRNQDERGDEWIVKNLGYGPFLEEATVAFLLPGSCRPWGQHYTWCTKEFRCYKFHNYLSPVQQNPTLSLAIDSGLCNPVELFKTIR